MYPTIGEMLEVIAEKYPDRDALIYPRRDQRWTYADLDAKANQLAHAFDDLGIEKGDRVSTLLYNGTEIILTLFACAKIGAVFNPLNYRLPAEQVKYLLHDAESNLLVFEIATRDVVNAVRSDLDSVEAYLDVNDQFPPYAEGFYDLLAAADDGRPDTIVDEDDVSSLLYTSGTTGRPKGVVHEHRNVVEHTVMMIAEGGTDRNDVGISTFPLYHAGELHGGLLPRVQLGCPTIVHHDFDPRRVLRDIDAYSVTVLFGAPTGWNALLQAAEEVDVDVSSMRLGLYSAAPMPANVLEGCFDVFDADFFQAYGMTEIGGVGTILHPEEHLEKRDSAGRPALNRAIRVVEPDSDPKEIVPRGEIGEVLIASPATMREYWRLPEQTAGALIEHGGKRWYYTGDLGYVDDDGYLSIVDRKDDMIITGGENVYPAHIDEALFAHPEIMEAAVVGEPDETWGERVVAYIVGNTTAEELDRYMQDNDAIADFERPRRYYFVDSLPKSPSGKVQKFKLQEGTAGVEPRTEEP